MTNLSTTKDKASAGDPIPSKCAVIEVHVGELKQLFDAPKAEEFIVGWAKDLPGDASLATGQPALGGNPRTIRIHDLILCVSDQYE